VPIDFLNNKLMNLWSIPLVDIWDKPGERPAIPMSGDYYVRQKLRNTHCTDFIFEYVIQAIIDSVKANESSHYDFTRKNAGRKLDL
jgi:hypothetical protein